MFSKYTKNDKPDGSLEFYMLDAHLNLGRRDHIIGIFIVDARHLRKQEYISLCSPYI